MEKLTPVLALLLSGLAASAGAEGLKDVTLRIKSVAESEGFVLPQEGLKEDPPPQAKAVILHPEPVPTEKPGLLESGVFEVYAGDSFKAKKRVEKLQRVSNDNQLFDIPRNDCSQVTLQTLDKQFRDSGSKLYEISWKIRSILGGPIPLFLSNKDRKEGWFHRQGTAGEFDSRTGAISIYCTIMRSGDMAHIVESSQILMHELGHLLMFRAYGSSLPVSPNRDIRHSSKDYALTSPAEAWVEGFAEFFSLTWNPSDTGGECALGDTCPKDIIKKMHADKEKIEHWLKDEQPSRQETIKDWKWGNVRWEWMNKPWEEKIASEDFVFALLAGLAGELNDKVGGKQKFLGFEAEVHRVWLSVDLEKMDRLLQPILQAKSDMPGGMHADLDEYLRHYLRTYPEEKPRVRKAVQYLIGYAPLPAWLAD